VTELNERLARIEGALEHVVKAVDVAAAHREDTADRLARVEQRIEHMERNMPTVRENARNVARASGWQAAKEDAQDDRRAALAIVISVLALFVGLLASGVNWVTR